MEFNSELMRFITGIQISSDGTVPLNNLDDPTSFESELYTPEYSVSMLTLIVLKKIDREEIEIVNGSVPEHTITHKVLDSDLASFAPDIYLLARLVVLESFALVYSINESKEDIEYINKKDMQRLKENINYLADFMGTQGRYHSMVDVLRDMYISLGYLEHQTDVIMNFRQVR